MKNIISILFILLSYIAHSQTNKEVFTAIFYNVENLFDTVDDPNTKDDDFTPLGKKQWNESRYKKKLRNISTVIASINEEELPELIGLCEIENQKVIHDLIMQERLKAVEYRFVHEDSQDARGIDVALLYNAEEFKYLGHKKIPIKYEFDPKYKTRDILYVKGIVNKIDTLHVFVNHWKSRSGGKEETEKYRTECAQTLRNEIDKIMEVYKTAKILVLGDFNDEPKDRCVYETLSADNSNNHNSLNNLMLPISENELGTYNYRGNWSVLDHIIVSKSLLNSNTGFIVKDGEAYVFSPDWITYESREGNKSPNRTYSGNNYYGGYSDHYPVYIILKKQ